METEISYLLKSSDLCWTFSTFSLLGLYRLCAWFWSDPLSSPVSTAGLWWVSGGPGDSSVTSGLRFPGLRKELLHLVDSWSCCSLRFSSPGPSVCQDWSSRPVLVPDFLLWSVSHQLLTSTESSFIQDVLQLFQIVYRNLTSQWFSEGFSHNSAHGKKIISFN